MASLNYDFVEFVLYCKLICSNLGDGAADKAIIDYILARVIEMISLTQRVLQNATNRN